MSKAKKNWLAREKKVVLHSSEKNQKSLVKKIQTSHDLLMQLTVYSAFD